LTALSSSEAFAIASNLRTTGSFLGGEGARFTTGTGAGFATGAGVGFAATGAGVVTGAAKEGVKAGAEGEKAAAVVLRVGVKAANLGRS